MDLHVNDSEPAADPSQAQLRFTQNDNLLNSLKGRGGYI